jgi:hypothetical protein
MAQPSNRTLLIFGFDMIYTFPQGLAFAALV